MTQKVNDVICGSLRAENFLHGCHLLFHPYLAIFVKNSNYG